MDNKYLGIDIGSVSMKFAVTNNQGSVLQHNYYRTHGDILSTLKIILETIKFDEFSGISVTGSGRKLIKALISADLDIDEITAHRKAIAKMYPNVKTIFEIGGQDSKLIYFGKNHIGFEMNNVCAAGTGSFLDQQASRLNMDIKKFCEIGLTTEESHKIASKCTVFAESDMIHAQQSGVPINKVIRGVHRGMINNYYSQLCLGKKLEGDFLFEGGTSENPVLVEELGNKLQLEGLLESKFQLIVPKPYHKVIGAVGAAYSAMDIKPRKRKAIPRINKFEFLDSQQCYDCPNKCGATITRIKIDNKIVIFGKTCQR